MAGTPAAPVPPPPPPPSNFDSSAPAFKSNSSGPSPGYEPAQHAAAAAVRIQPDALVAVLGVVGELRARGLLARLEIPEADLTDARAPALFDRVLAAFLAETWDPEAASSFPIPPPPFGDGHRVELLRLFLAVRAGGGFAAVASWAAVAEAVGLDPAADGTAVKLLYRKYLELLDRKFDRPLEDHKAVENAGRRLGSAKDKYLSPTKDAAASAGSAHLKRKRDPLVGTLNWVRLVAKSPAEPGIDIDPHGHFDTAVWLRDNACLGGERLEGMLNWVHLVAKSPAEQGVVGEDSCVHLSTAALLRSRTFANNDCSNGSALPQDLHPREKSVSIDLTNDIDRNGQHVGRFGSTTTKVEADAPWADSCPGLLYINIDLNEARQGGFRVHCPNQYNSQEDDTLFQSEHSNEEALGSVDRLFAAPIRPCGQADIPEWTGKPPSRHEDRRALRFLGEPILLPESNEALDGGSIGKGRQDDCSCQFPGSIDCVRLHVAEKKDELKRELGSAFYKMGLHQTGEDAALAWTKADERRFNTIIQDNVPTSKYNFWDKLRVAFRSKGSKGLASYYHNVFQVRRRAYQNHLALNADSDEDTIEPGFLYSRQVDIDGKNGSRSASSSRKRKSS
ncbi:unnamed protein product [Urochloa decumbens]|uniref:ARID domain-containing protein n=1 Tax=Urochloa decumbens TaxID=240449 RepID=A0ABC8YG14_9POAL